MTVAGLHFCTQQDISGLLDVAVAVKMMFDYDCWKLLGEIECCVVPPLSCFLWMSLQAASLPSDLLFVIHPQHGPMAYSRCKAET